MTQVAHREGRQSYDDLIDRAVSLRLDDYELRLINLDDLIASKEAADRDQDHEALQELRRLRDGR